MDHLLSIKDLSQQQLLDLLALAKAIKANPADYRKALDGKSVVMLFEKPSLRTRVSFDIGINKLGGHCLYLDQQNGALGKREPVSDFAANISCWADAIVARTFLHSTIEQLAEHGSVPVINALSDLYHPCQGLADFLTLSEQYEDVSKVRLAYVGDGNNVTHSLMFAAAILGAHLTVLCPPGHFPDGKVVCEAQALAEKHGGTLVLSSDVAAIAGHDAIYTDTWISMGDGASMEEIEAKFKPYQVNAELMAAAGAKHFMHCLPAYREVEATADIVDGAGSLILQQAENRMHAQNAVLVTLLGQ
ncbi:ornithine carbamoyltransferase [Shewanella sp. Choline-02u-19]|jgi:ornithine carbamoyltransferase|uniref:ornithine carbamoyltransferase n=1 Tax=unclassified Shewanella TaxID=196818 RepID=UPI000C31D775|nr:MULTISPECIES: ornithine carbamoyltransferase [unclassified Shewanella]PKG57596.1 ornithine carbamoyltransferase [Shewanella sp. GutDb-MelDb]PKG75605.1 ornithine carbamoyltransferase [Shewanella sp. GutCb]PKH54005.1 ornithine carbamoyltransferase [Shewanella sp. Bg11-22]PKI30518.1 ornithine carbamoyltransferase [Shewanella sp. Choline-02u-19]